VRRDGPIEQVYERLADPGRMGDRAPALEGPRCFAGTLVLSVLRTGRTAGPPTSHMAIVARSRRSMAHGDCRTTRSCGPRPARALVSRGHATAVQGRRTTGGLAYHGYENGFRTSQQMLLEPFTWDADGWPRQWAAACRGPCRAGGRAWRPAPAPVRLVGPFLPDMFGTRLAFLRSLPGYLDRVRIADGA